MSENYYIGNYKVIETQEIGKLIPCPCDDPVILEFKNGIRDAFHLRELEPTSHPITNAYPTRGIAAKNGQKGRPKGIEQGTINKMMQIHAFLETQSTPVYRQAIENAVGFNCTRSLMYQPSQPKQITLESLGIAERIPGERTWVTWSLTELGRRDGVDIIRKLRLSSPPDKRDLGG